MDDGDAGEGTSYPVTESHVIHHASPSSPPTPRVKAYPPDSNGPYVVFFRPKGKRLNTCQISKDLTKRFSSVISIDLVGTNKLRVTVGDRLQANEIAAFELFTLEYHVYLPSHEVEISGVVTEPSLTREEIMSGCGRFKNESLPPVPILECKPMYSVSRDGEKKIYSQSNSFCVTFSGSALPKLLVIGKLRLPVRLYVPKVMNCENCKQLGHTTQYCCNKSRCASCGEGHVDGACKTAPKCVYCGANPPHALDACPTYIQRRVHQKRSLQQLSRRSYAEMLKKAAPPVESSNLYSSLPLDDQGTDSEVSDGVTLAFKGTSRKRFKSIQKPSKKRRKLPSSASSPNMSHLNAGGKSVKRSIPGFNLLEERDFPSLPGSSKNPDVPCFPISRPAKQHKVREEQPQSTSMFTLSGIVDTILNFFNASDLVKTMVKGILPSVSPFLKQLASKLPLLATIISFDG